MYQCHDFARFITTTFSQQCICEAAAMSGNLAPTDSLSWPKSNYINPERRSWMPMYVGVLQGLSSVVAILRFWLRARKQAGTLGLDDVCAFEASLF